MAGIDFQAIRAAVSLQAVLDLLRFAASERKADQLRGPCPIHGSQSPQSRSFSAILKRNAFRCFTCGAAGNQLDLWSRAQSLSLYDAAIDLCQRLQIPVPRLAQQAGRSSAKPGAEKRNPQDVQTDV